MIRSITRVVGIGIKFSLAGEMQATLDRFGAFSGAQAPRAPKREKLDRLVSLRPTYAPGSHQRCRTSCG